MFLNLYCHKNEISTVLYFDNDYLYNSEIQYVYDQISQYWEVIYPVSRQFLRPSARYFSMNKIFNIGG